MELHICKKSKGKIICEENEQGLSQGETNFRREKRIKSYFQFKVHQYIKHINLFEKIFN